MTFRLFVSRISAAAGALGIAVAIVAASPGLAAAQSAPTHQATATTSTTGGAVADRIIFTPIAHKGAAPATAFACSVSYPEVTDTFSNGEFSWSASVSCNIVLRMQGTTVLYQWGSSSAFAFSSSYDHSASFSSSSGAYYGIFSGTWGVNNNVLLFIPSGYTTTLGGGCYYATSTEIHCTATTGPITAQ
jgi:hypothetical protein